MRTTVTLDDDVAVLIEARRRATGKGFKDVLNEALREALAKRSGPSRRGTPKFRTFSVGKLLIEDLDDVSAVIERLEGPSHR